MNKFYLDKDFEPAYIKFKKFQDEVKKSKKHTNVHLAFLKDEGLVYRFSFLVYDDLNKEEKNKFFLERIIKTILWIIGGYEIYISGPYSLFLFVKNLFEKDGNRYFDKKFMENIYEKEFKVIYCEYENLPLKKSYNLKTSTSCKGRRIGFDAGGTDRKTSCVVDGEVVYSEEVVWNPKEQSDPIYHINEINKALSLGVEKLNGDVDAIGISSAGIYIDNEARVASLFKSIPKDLFDKNIKKIYINAVKKLEDKLGHSIPLMVANDGDVTAIAGAKDLKDNKVLGIAMGTSEAAGYVDENNCINGWLSELCFVPVDFNKNAPIDEWSNDYGVGSKYFSQDAVIRLAEKINVVFDDKLTLGEKLSYVQMLLENNTPKINLIFKTIGMYLAYSLVYYSLFYDIKHVLILGRVTSKKGGQIILDTCNKILKKKFKNVKFDVSIPSEYMKRVGQAIAASSLEKI